MIIKVLKNRLKVNIDDDLQKVTEYFKLKGYEVIFNTQECDLKLPKLTANGTDNGQIQYVLKMKEACKGLRQGVTIFTFNADELTVPSDGYITSSAGEGDNFITLKTNGNDDVTGFLWKSICHEIMHVYFRKLNGLAQDPMDGMLVSGVWQTYYKNDNPDAKDGNFAEAFKRLKPFKERLDMSFYRYFTYDEIKGLKPELVAILDEARHIAGVPFIIGSGLRTALQNASVGGVKNSAHLDGLAVDLRVSNSVSRFAIVKGLMNCGTPVFIEDARGHIHIDIKSSIHPMNSLFWSNDD